MQDPAAERRMQDALLVRQIQSGQLYAFTELVGKYQDRIYTTCWRICGNQEDARDLTQDVFVKALESIGDFRGRSAFYTWVFRIAVNMALSHKRKMKTRRTLSLTAGADDAGQAADLLDVMSDPRSVDPSQAFEARESGEQVAAAILDLEEDQRCVLVLRDVEGMSYQDIADILDVAVGTVKSRIYRARLALRNLLEGASGGRTA